MMKAQAMTDWQTTEKNDNFLADLSTTGLISVTGEDAISFLQGQVTNDVNAISAAHSHYSGYCNPKGRLLALFFIFRHQDKLYLSLDAGLVPSIQKRLQMYIMRAKVTLTDEQANIACLGVAGDTAAQQLQTLYPTIPTEDYAIIQHDDVTIIRMPTIKPAFQIITNVENREAVFETLSQVFTSTDKAAWQHLETLSGIPEIVEATQEAFVPQMINLDALGGINFKKGCYTGQEIVARTHYLGKVKRRTLLGKIKASTEKTPVAGDPVSDMAQQNVGQVVRTTPGRNGDYFVLFECRLDSLDTPIQWERDTIAIQPMPYELAVDAK